MPPQRHAAAHPSDHRLHLSAFKKASACFPCRARTSVPACERSNVRFVPQIILAARARTLEPCDFHLTLARLRMIDCGITSSIAAANAGVVQAACNVTAACARAFDAGRAGDHVGALDQAIARPEVDPLPKPSPKSIAQCPRGRHRQNDHDPRRRPHTEEYWHRRGDLGGRSRGDVADGQGRRLVAPGRHGPADAQADKSRIALRPARDHAAA